MKRKRATLTAVIARLDRATQYSGLPKIHTNGGDYWFPAFAGMTNLCTLAAAPQTILIDMSGRPSILHNSTSPLTTGPTFSGVPE